MNITVTSVKTPSKSKAAPSARKLRVPGEGSFVLAPEGWSIDINVAIGLHTFELQAVYRTTQKASASVIVTGDQADTVEIAITSESQPLIVRIIGAKHA